MQRRQNRFLFCVQGVGFRYLANDAAAGQCFTGWVRNEYDGSVMMEVQGNESLIDRMLQILNRDMYIDIQSMETKNISVDEEEKSFRVLY